MRPGRLSGDGEAVAEDGRAGLVVGAYDDAWLLGFAVAFVAYLALRRGRVETKETGPEQPRTIPAPSNLRPF